MAQVSGWDTTAVGQEAESLAGATCIGHYSGALGEESIVLGSYARAFERNSIAIGNGAVSYRGSALTISAVPCIGMDVRGSVASSDGSTRADKATTTVAQLFTHPVELAAGVPWTPSTVLTHGGIIRPPTPNGFYYIVSRDTFQLRPPLTFTITTGLNEPGWPTPAGQFNWMVEGMIVAINGTTAEIFVPPGMTFFPDEFGFICTDYSAVSAPPSVSIGTRENPTLFVNNQSMTGITGPNTRHRFGNINAGVEQWVRFTISLRAASTDTGTMQGRFYMSGTALERKGA